MGGMAAAEVPTTPARLMFWGVPALLAGLIAAGTILIRIAGFPDYFTATFRNGFEPWLQSAFMAVSATCGVGLWVRDPATQMTGVGQWTLWVLGDLGALVYMTVGARAVLGLMGGRRVSLRFTLTGVLVLLLGLEAVGTAVLFFGRYGWGGSAADLARTAADAVSATAQVGFCVDPGALQAQIHTWTVYLVLVPLMFLGSIGLPVILDIVGTLLMPHPPESPSREATPSETRNPGICPPAPGQGGPGTGTSPRRLHPLTRDMLGAWLGTYITGVVLLMLVLNLPAVYQALGRNVEMANRTTQAAPGGWAAAVADAGYLAATARSSGLSPLSLNAVPAAGLLVLMGLMFLGGIPGSAAGGLGMLALAAAVHPGRHKEAVIRYALGAAAVLAALTLVGSLILAMSDPTPPLARTMFEVVSAASGSGLSVGLTPDLSALGQGALLLIMLLGRWWPLGLLQRAARTAG